MKLSLKNNVTKQEIVFSEVVDEGVSALYYTFNIALPNKVEEGEYTYTLMDGNKVVATGLVQIGDYKAEKTTYNKNNEGYIVYGG